MIGVFAKMFRGNEHVTEVSEEENGLAVKAREPEGIESHTTIVDEPPEAFVEKMEYDGGSFYVIPFMEAFRSWVRKQKATARGEDAESASTDAE